MVMRPAILAFVALVLCPFAIRAETPSTHGPYTYYQLDPDAQQYQNQYFYARLRADWAHQHDPTRGGHYAPGPDTVPAMEAAMRDYWKRHPKDRPELWRFQSKDER